MRAAAEHCRRRSTAIDVVAAFLDHDAPDLATAAAASDDDVVVVPLLLSSAFHARVDVPAAVAAPAPQVSCSRRCRPPAVGCSTPCSAPLLGPAVVVAAGTRVDEERAALRGRRRGRRGTHRRGRRRRLRHRPGAQDRRDPRPGATVVPWLLAPGRLLDRVRLSAAAHRVPCSATGCS